MRQLVSTGMEARLRRYIVSLLTLFAIGSTTATAAGPGGQSLSLGVPAYRLPIVNVAVAGLVGLSLFALLGFLYARQRRLGNEAREMTRRLQGIIDGTRAGTWEWNVQTGETRFNERWAEMVGYTLAELAPTTIETWTKLVHPDDLEESQRRLERHFRGETDYYAAVVRMRHRDGHWVWVYDRGRVISRTSDGKPHWVRGTHVDDTARHRLTEAERAWYGQFRMHANSVPGVLYQFRSDAEGNFSFPFVSDRLRAVHGCDAAEAMQDANVVFSTIEPADRLRILSYIESSHQTLVPWEATYRIRHPERGERWIHGRSTPACDDDGGITWYGYVQDVTEFQQAQEKIEEAAEVFEAAQEGIIVTDASHRIVEVNRAFAEMLGYVRDELQGQSIEVLFFEADRTGLIPRINDILDREDGVWRGEMRYRRKDGQVLPGEAFVSTVRNQERGTVRHIAVVHDISERLRYEDELRRLASYDTLTGLPNRRLLADRLHQAIAHATRTGEHFSVGMLDLDWFKPVNDRYGHEAGDEVLCVIARRLSNHLRAEDTVARLGGDEFVLVIRESADDGAIFDRILAAISEPIPLRGVGAIVNVSGSIGVAHFDAERPLQGDQLLRHADQAVYRAKASGREQIVTFEAMEAGSKAL